MFETFVNCSGYVQDILNGALQSPGLIEQLGVWNEVCAKGTFVSCGSAGFHTSGKPNAVAIFCIPTSDYFLIPSHGIAFQWATDQLAYDLLPFKEFTKTQCSLV